MLVRICCNLGSILFHAKLRIQENSRYLRNSWAQRYWVSIRVQRVLASLTHNSAFFVILRFYTPSRDSSWILSYRNLKPEIRNLITPVPRDKRSPWSHSHVVPALSLSHSSVVRVTRDNSLTMDCFDGCKLNLKDLQGVDETRTYVLTMGSRERQTKKKTSFHKKMISQIQAIFYNF